MTELKKAYRKQVKIRMSVAGPTGFGKTITALLIAFGITKDWGKIAVIDTENESALLYSDHTLKKSNFHIGEFNTIALKPPFTPEKYTEAIKICEDAGMEVIILDSITHVWSGQGGLLEANRSGGRYQDWNQTTRRYQMWLESILHSSAHVITTNRKKQSYSLVNEGGRIKVEKFGLEDQIRDGYDYEMTVALEIINNQHLCIAAKDRTGLFSGIPEFAITMETGELIKKWCELGKAEMAVDYISRLEGCSTLEELKEVFFHMPKAKQTEYRKLANTLKTKLTAVIAGLAAKKVA